MATTSSLSGKNLFFGWVFNGGGLSTAGQFNPLMNNGRTVAGLVGILTLTMLGTIRHLYSQNHEYQDRLYQDSARLSNYQDVLGSLGCDFDKDNITACKERLRTIQNERDTGQVIVQNIKRAGLLDVTLTDPQHQAIAKISEYFVNYRETLQNQKEHSQVLNGHLTLAQTNVKSCLNDSAETHREFVKYAQLLNDCSIEKTKCHQSNEYTKSQKEFCQGELKLTQDSLESNRKDKDQFLRSFQSCNTALSTCNAGLAKIKADKDLCWC